MDYTALAENGRRVGKDRLGPYTKRMDGVLKCVGPSSVLPRVII